MSIQRDPHGVFAGVWAGWFACVLFSLARPDAPLLGLVVLVAFLPIEGIAIATRSPFRDTLSEIVTWVVTRLSKHDRTGRGWNVLVWLVAFPVAFLLYRTVLHYSGAPFLAFGMAVPLLVMLHDHWLHPEVHG